MVLFAAQRKEQERRTIAREIKVDRNYEIGAIKEQRQGEKGPKVWPFFHLQPQRRGRACAKCFKPGWPAP